MARTRLTVWAYEFLRFGMKQVWACLFGGIMVALLIVSYTMLAQSISHVTSVLTQ